MNDTLQRIVDVLTLYGLKVIAAIIILIVGRWIAKLVKQLVQKLLNKKNVDPMITSFVGNLTFALLMTFVVIAALGRAGIPTGSFIAVVGAAGLAIGLALQGSLANFAAGFLMIIFRPFKKGDYIEGAGTAGIVEQIQIFTTILNTPDNKKVIIPNAKLMGDNITNYSATGTRRVEFVVGVSYDDDIDKVKNTLQQIIAADERILEEPASMIAVKELADSAVNFVMRAWVKTDHYWDVYFDTTEKIKKSLDDRGISIPYPQTDIHLYDHKKNQT